MLSDASATPLSELVQISPGGVAGGNYVSAWQSMSASSFAAGLRPASLTFSSGAIPRMPQVMNSTDYSVKSSYKTYPTYLGWILVAGILLTLGGAIAAVVAFFFAHGNLARVSELAFATGLLCILFSLRKVEKPRTSARAN